MRRRHLDFGMLVDLFPALKCIPIGARIASGLLRYDVMNADVRLKDQSKSHDNVTDSSIIRKETAYYVSSIF